MEPECSLPYSQEPAQFQRCDISYQAAFYGEELLAPRQTPNWSTTRCRLSAAAYSIQPQLPTVSENRLLYPQPEDASCHGDRDPPNTSLITNSMGQDPP